MFYTLIKQVLTNQRARAGFYLYYSSRYYMTGPEVAGRRSHQVFTNFLLYLSTRIADNDKAIVTILINC